MGCTRPVSRNMPFTETIKKKKKARKGYEILRSPSELLCLVELSELDVPADGVQQLQMTARLGGHQGAPCFCALPS